MSSQPAHDNPDPNLPPAASAETPVKKTGVGRLDMQLLIDKLSEENAAVPDEDAITYEETRKAIVMFYRKKRHVAFNDFVARALDGKPLRRSERNILRQCMETKKASIKDIHRRGFIMQTAAFAGIVTLGGLLAKDATAIVDASTIPPPTQPEEIKELRQKFSKYVDTHPLTPEEKELYQELDKELQKAESSSHPHNTGRNVILKLLTYAAMYVPAGIGVVVGVKEYRGAKNELNELYAKAAYYLACKVHAMTGKDKTPEPTPGSR